MSLPDAAGVILAVGAGQLAATALTVLAYALMILGGLYLAGLAFWGAVLFIAWRASRRNPIEVVVFGGRPPECPCCTGRPYETDDCTCREPCGEAWCQAEDPDGELNVPGWVNQPGPVVTCHDQARADALQREIDDMIERYGNG